MAGRGLRGRGAAIVTAIVVVGVMLVVVEGAAPATFTGTYRGGRNVRLVTNSRGEFNHISFKSWSAPCGGGARFRTGTTFVSAGTSTPTKFFSKGSYVMHQKKGDYDSTVTAAVRGKRISLSRWTGTFRTSVVVRTDGKVIARCAMPATRWRAHLKGDAPIGQPGSPAQLDLSSESGDPVGLGMDYHYETPADHVTVAGNRQTILATAGPWHLRFAAPNGKTIGDGSFGHAHLYPGQLKHPGIDVSVDGRGCDQLSGFFAIDGSKFDRDGNLLALKLTFEQRCSGVEPALRGTLTLSDRAPGKAMSLADAEPGYRPAT
jgi:hypothetical protein